MVVYVTESGSDRTELTEALVQEGVTYQECKSTIEAESDLSGTIFLEVQANLPEVFPVPPEFAESDSSVRAYRLPSGRMIITDMEGNLERIASAPPRYT